MINVFKTIDLDKSNGIGEIKHLEKGVYCILNNGVEEVLEVLDVDIESKMMRIRHNHNVYQIEFKNDLDFVLDKMGIKRTLESLNTDITAPMPGKVIDIVVEVGDVVKKGDAILILEAMKMENVLKAENNCSIKKVHVSSSENVEKNQVLVELDVV